MEDIFRREQGKDFKLVFNRKWFAVNDVITAPGAVLVVQDEPVQKEILVKSKWWIVNWWRKITKTEIKESVYTYTVKFINDGTE